MAKAKLTLEDLLVAQRKLVQEGDVVAEKTLVRLESLAKSSEQQTASLEAIESNITADRSAAQLISLTQASKQQVESLNKVSDAVTHQRGDALNANIIKLTDEIRKALTSKIGDTYTDADIERSPIFKEAVKEFEKGFNAAVNKTLKEFSESVNDLVPDTPPTTDNRPAKPAQRVVDAGRMIEQGEKYQKGFKGALDEWENKRMFTPSNIMKGKNPFDLKNIFDVENSSGILGAALKKKVAKEEYIENQLKINPQNKNLKQYQNEKGEYDPRLERKALGERFEKINTVRGKIQSNEKEIRSLEEAGMTEKEISRGGYLKRRRELEDELAGADPRFARELKDEASVEDVPKKTSTPKRATAKRSVEPAQPSDAPTLAVLVKPAGASPAEAPPKPAVQIPALLKPFGEPKPTTAAGLISAAAKSEVDAENLRLMQEQTEILRKIEENTAGIRGTAKSASTKKKDEAQQQAAPEEGGSILGDLVDMIPMGGLKKAGGALLKAGRGLAGQAGKLATRAAPWAVPVAAAYGAANVLDWGVGKFGVGKTAEGEDIQVDEKADDANWDKMSFFQKTQSGLARGIEKVGSFVGLGNMARQARADRIAKESEYLAPKEKDKAIPVSKEESFLGKTARIASLATPLGLLNEKNREMIGEGAKAVGGKVKSFFGGIADTFNRGTSGTAAAQNMEAEVQKRMAEKGVQPFTPEANAIRKQVREEILAKDPTAFAQATQAVSSNVESGTTERSDGSSTSQFKQNVVSNKSILGSTTLGSLFTKKGLQTGGFTGTSEVSKVAADGTSSAQFNEVIGSKEATGLFEEDKYTLTGSTGEPIKVSKKTYNQVQELVKAGKTEEAAKIIASIEAAQKETATKATPVKSASAPGAFSVIGNAIKDAGRSVGSFAKQALFGKTDVSQSKEAQGTVALGAQLQNLDTLKQVGGYADVDPATQKAQQAMRDKYEAEVTRLKAQGWNEDTLRGKESGFAKIAGNVKSFFGLGEKPGDALKPALARYQAEEDARYNALIPRPTQADTVSRKTQELAAAQEQSIVTAPVIVNAPQNSNVQNQTVYSSKPVTRNTDSTMRHYSASRIAYG